MTSATSPAMVEIMVQDPATHHERAFLCALGPLRTHMQYFEPIIQRQMSEAKALRPSASSSSSAVALTLRARCDHATFQWLMGWVSGKGVQITNDNVVSICLSSSFLRMQELSDNALMYLSAHLQEIVPSSFDLTNLPMHLVLRLSHMVRDNDIAAALLRLHEERCAYHPNRMFVASLLQHYVCHQVGVADGAEAVSRTATATTGDANGSARAPAESPATRSGELILPPTCSLRWCRLCATLFDEGEMHRLSRASQLSSPECPAHSGPMRDASNRAHHVEATGPTWRVGPRGEVFTTHAAAPNATPVVLEAPPALKGSGVSASTAAAEAASPFPAELERWAWRIIGASRYVGCQRCFHLVSLLDVPHHRCSELPEKYWSPGNAAEDVQYLVRWLNYCTEHRVYEQEGGLTPMQYKGPAEVLAGGVVIHSFRSTPDPMWRGASKATSGVAVDSVANPATARASLCSDDISLWAAMPFYVKEVMSENAVDVDILNYVERQHRLDVEAQQRKVPAAQKSFAMRLSIAPAGPGIAGGRAGGLLASSSSPRPLSGTGAMGRSRGISGDGTRGARLQVNLRTSPYGSLPST
ncbi:hypothetical protein LSCM1_03189 [Leishmania martiniquensis]|uniref:SANT and BTB domain-containing protein n=1 Tax=Leishmania martiniquensis TaxID=1580590 RepID=A0A836GUY6_9TRYP|nr:hypothetical protein LSCM1_03189 [Leishmania martiniquensis]